MLWFVIFPNVGLVSVTTPIVSLVAHPAVEDRLILSLIIGPAQGKGILGPNDKGGPFAAGFHKCRIKSVQFGRTHANVSGTLAIHQHIGAGIIKELLEIFAKVIIHNSAAMVRTGVIAELVFHCCAVVNIIWRVGKDHIGHLVLH